MIVHPALLTMLLLILPPDLEVECVLMDGMDILLMIAEPVSLVIKHDSHDSQVAPISAKLAQQDIILITSWNPTFYTHE